MGASLRGSMSSARDAVTGELEASRKSKGAADAAGELLGELVLEMDQIPPNADLTGWLPLLRRSGEPGGELQVRYRGDIGAMHGRYRGDIGEI